MKLTALTIRGKECEVYISQTGNFSIHPAGSEGKVGTILGNGTTLEAAKQAAARAISQTKVKVRVPFVTFGGKRGHATGIRTGGRKISVRVNGRSEAFDLYTSVFRPDIDAQVLARYSQLVTDIKKLTAEKYQIERDYKLDLAAAVRDAVAAAEGTREPA